MTTLVELIVISIITVASHYVTQGPVQVNDTLDACHIH